MLSLLPMTFFIIVFFTLQKPRPAFKWRDSFLSASLIWGLFVTFSTEFLGIFSLINLEAVLIFWLLSIVIALMWFIRTQGSLKFPDARLYLTFIPRPELLLLLSLFMIVAIVGIIAWISPPNNSDSMTYHMSRVVHWIQNQNLSFYPTHIPRQLHSNPWAEFAIMHFQILSGGDRFANLIQWFSMIGTVGGVSLLARQLGADLRGQIFSAVFCATIPMGILQGSSTQTDYAVSFWLVLCAYYALLLKDSGKYLHSLQTGAGLGLAILTKATAYIWAFPFMALISISLIKSHRVKGFFLIIIIIAPVLLLNIGHYMRNYDLYGSPLGDGKLSGPGQDKLYFDSNGNPLMDKNMKYANGIFTPSAFTSNTIRNMALHLSTFGQMNAILEKFIYKIHEYIGLGVNDPRTTWAGEEFHIIPLSLHEDHAGNLLHLVLIMISIPIVLWQQQQNRGVCYYLFCLLGAFILFCLYLRWHTTFSRLHLPFFILWSPLIGLFLSQIHSYRIANLCMVILFIGALPWLLHNSTRPLWGHTGQESILSISRPKLYFNWNRPLLYEPYLRAVQFVSNSQCRDIGIMLGANDWEYPFWVFLGKNIRQKFRLEHINVTNVSAIKYKEYPFNTFSPCALIVVSDNAPKILNIKDVIYLREWLSAPIYYMQKWSSPVSVFMPKR